MAQLISYGAYIPMFRLKLEDIARVWGKQPEEITKSLGVVEKSVPGIDEDAVTIALEAAHQSLVTFQGIPGDIGALFIGSESHPYAVNPTSTIVGELLGIGHNYLAADLEFACKGATAGVQAIAGLIDAGQIQLGLAIGTDTAQSKPHDALEYTSAAAGVALLLGKNSGIAHLLFYTSYSSDTPDFWRRDGIRYPSHAGRFTGEPAYFAHIVGAARLLLEKSRSGPGDFAYCVFHMPNGKFPREVAKRLGFTQEQLAPSLVVESIGNPYSASALLGLAAVLDIAKPGQKICMVSYGSGAGADGFIWEVTKEIPAYRRTIATTITEKLKTKKYINYSEYLKQTHKL